MNKFFVVASSIAIIVSVGFIVFTDAYTDWFIGNIIINFLSVILNKE